MKIIIAGCRDFDDYELLEKYMDHLLQDLIRRGEPIEIVSGGAKGADALGERYARERNYPLTRFCAEWDKYGRKAGPMRNRQMGDYADALVAFWDGESAGTRDMIECAKRKGLRIRIKRMSLQQPLETKKRRVAYSAKNTVKSCYHSTLDGVDHFI